MTDIYQGSTGGATSVLPPPAPPQWTADPPPWAPSWLPPTQPGGAGGGYGSGPYGPEPEWQPPPPETPKARQGRGVAIVVIAALLSAVIGVVIGSRLAPRNTTSVASSSTPTLPSASGTIPSAGGFTPSFGTTPTAPSAGALPADTSAIAAKVMPGIVDINTQLSYQNAAAAGTGMVLTASGEVLTNNHVIDQATSITVTIPSTGKIYTATVVGDDPTEDVAVLQLKGASGLKTVPLGDSSKTSVGDAVVALGNAGGVGGSPSIVTGTVQALNQTITASDENGGNQETLDGLIQTNAPIQAGDSGGPLVNTNGQVIGMDTAASSSVRRFYGGSSTTASFAIPIDHALSVAQQIEAGKASSTVQIGLPGFLGVGLSSTYTGSGAEVTNVAPATPADNAGLAANDVITALDGTPITSAQGLTTAMQGRRPGSKVTLTWTTPSGSARSASLTLAAGPAN